MVVSVSLLLAQCAIVGKSILSNPEPLPGRRESVRVVLRWLSFCAASFRWATSALPNENRDAGVDTVPAYCAIMLHGLLCLPIFFGIFAGGMR
jgi:hypothetical protein